MRQIIGSIEGEYRRYKAVGERAIDQLTDAQLSQASGDGGNSVATVALSVHEALHRSLPHTSYHVGQIVFLAKALRGSEWRHLTIPTGGSAVYNANPFAEKPPGPR